MDSGPMIDEAPLESFFELGYAIVPNVLNNPQIADLLKATEFQDAGATHARGGQPHERSARHQLPHHPRHFARSSPRLP